MRSDVAPRITPRLLFGLFAILAGVLLTLDNLGVMRVRFYWRYWPLLLIAVGLVRVLQPGTASGRGFGTLVENLHLFSFDLVTFWPLALVVLGIVLVWGVMGRGRGDVVGPSMSSSWFNSVAVLGSVQSGSNAADFRGGEATALLGSCELDLRQASIASGEAIVDTFTMWGGIDIKVPEDWSVVIQGVPIMGSFEDKTRQPTTLPTKTLVIKGIAIMGGIEVSN
jgi:hypothetical protein